MDTELFLNVGETGEDITVTIPFFHPFPNYPARFLNVVDKDSVLNYWKCSVIYLSQSLQPNT